MQQQFEAERQTTESLEKIRGRIERRRLISTTAVNEYLQWPGTAQVCQMARTVTRGTETTIEVHYAIASVPRSMADASQLSAWWRGHWGIENKLHWVRDVTFGEDHCRIRTGTTPQVFSAFRNTAISYLRSLGTTNIAAKLRENALKVNHLPSQPWHCVRKAYPGNFRHASADPFKNTRNASKCVICCRVSACYGFRSSVESSSSTAHV